MFLWIEWACYGEQELEFFGIVGDALVKVHLVHAVQFRRSKFFVQLLCHRLSLFLPREQLKDFTVAEGEPGGLYLGSGTAQARQSCAKFGIIVFGYSNRLWSLRGLLTFWIFHVGLLIEQLFPHGLLGSRLGSHLTRDWE